MSFIYRTAVIVSRKQPYVDWANAIEGGPKVTAELNRRPDIYLVTAPERLQTRDEVVNEWWSMIFEEELAAWVETEEHWPSGRTREVFESWFDIEISDDVVDLVPDEPLTEVDVELAELAAVATTCAWCGLELDEGQGRSVGFSVRPPDRFSHRAGLTLTLPVDRNQIVTGVVPEDGSEAKGAGHDLVFTICTTRCAKGLTKAVTRVLHRLETRTVGVRPS